MPTEYNSFKPLPDERFLQASARGFWQIFSRRKLPASFLQFTVGIPLLCTPFRQGLAPTTEQFCCTVGNRAAQRYLCSRRLPTAKCRSYREEKNCKNCFEKSGISHKFVTGRPLEALELKMKINDELLRQIVSDLSLDEPFAKGKKLAVRNCWHFYTDGSSVDRLFDDDTDFTNAMNRIFVISRNYNVIILAFCLMDTHIHFILYGQFSECNKFMHEYIRLTSRNISLRHNEKKKLFRLPLSHQYIDNDFYLKTAIAYVIKNAPVGGLGHNAWDYPWCSGGLYFRQQGYWTSPGWKDISPSNRLSRMTYRQKRAILNTKNDNIQDASVIGKIIFPGEYVAYELVENIFKSVKSFNWFMCISKEEDVESRGGSISHLSIPIQEMRQHRNDICRELFNSNSIRTLNTTQRMKLAKVLRSRYNCSIKQIARLCGLVYGELAGIIN